MAGEEAVKGARTRLRSWQMEAYPGNEEEQEQETPQREAGRVGKTREGGEDSKAVRDVGKKKNIQGYLSTHTVCITKQM